ncbi:MAG: hypothetical protein AMJ56_16280 [Anaerolineae bacterium SG8_19]|jgi:hypothetical protein|nr:MAG: hypothetical protein AMJ56_16280 [Anaerolineae bacterium SG8_19]
MTTSVKAPKITHLSWGQVQIEGFDKPFKDVKLYPGGAREWDWNETGTRHVPGIQPEDVQELLDHGAQIVILSRGKQRRLEISPETLDYLAQYGVPAELLQTDRAVQRYNELLSEEAVGALIHSTC